MLMAKSLSLHEHGCIVFFSPEYSNFQTALDLHALQCAVMVKILDSMRLGLGVCRANG